MKPGPHRIGPIGSTRGGCLRQAVRSLALAASLFLLVSPALAAGGYENLTVEQLLERLREEGVVLFYSSDLVKPWMRVRKEPQSRDPKGVLEEVLAPYQLTVTEGPDGSLVLVRIEPAQAPPVGHIVGELLRADTALPIARARVRLIPTEREARTDASGRFAFHSLPAGRYVIQVDDDQFDSPRESVAEVSNGNITTLRIEVAGHPSAIVDEIVVEASRYQFVRHPFASFASLDASDLRMSPDVGDDPLRAVARLPGTASSDFSAKSNLRGGEVDETLVRFDDLRLYNPFHLKDFQSLFSAIDPAIISGIDVYTGGFPAVYGDRMSGVLDVAALEAHERPYREVSLSFFNASALAAASFDDGAGDWLVSARRGNLDLIFDIVDPSLGQPRYTDLYARLGRRLNDRLTLSGSLLRFDDDILLFDSDQEEQARADYRDEYYWLRLDARPNERLSGALLLARSRLESHRRGEADLPGISSGMLDDRRSFTIQSLATEWSWRWHDDVLAEFGAEWRSMEGRYDYRDEVAFDLLVLAPGSMLESERTRELGARPVGDHYGAYASLRLGPFRNVVADAGLRWDRDTLSPGDGDEWSPRLSLLYLLGPTTRLRASWGRFHQAQAVDELQIADGVVDFLPAQRADHLVFGFEHRFGRGIDLRLEAYRKDYDNLRPRYENLLNTFFLLPELKPDRVRVTPDSALARGIEVSLRRQSEDPLSWWLSYTWSEVTDTERGRRTRRKWDQTHLVTGGISWQSERWELSLAGTYHTGWPTTELTLIATEPVPLAVAGPRNSRRLDPYLAFDARVSRKYHLASAGTLAVFLQLTNLLNHSNDCCVEYEVEDADDELTLDTAALNGLPILPSLGFIWQF